MKFGETLQHQTFPVFRRHNIDYDDIKLLIKERTTPGEGKAISVPGRGDERLREFEQDLFVILKEQHDRIGMFVKCKVGEVQRRQADCNKLLEKIAHNASSEDDSRTRMRRLQRYGRLENGVIRAADELKSLARFTAIQRTAFRKLLKKFKKWTGSADLEDRFRSQVIDDPKSFTKLDLGPMLDEYSSTRHKIRSLYEETLRQASRQVAQPGADGAPVKSPLIQSLRAAIDSDSMSQFDTTFATVALGESGAFATYFVHPEMIVETQMFLLQYARFFSARSRSNSVARPLSPSRPSRFSIPTADPADYHMIAADRLDRFAKEQSALTVDDREHSRGSALQRAKATVFWNPKDGAIALLRSRADSSETTAFKSKRAAVAAGRSNNVTYHEEVRDNTAMFDLLEEIKKAEPILPLFEISCCRSRFVGLQDDAESIVMMALDTDISIHSADVNATSSYKSDFPYALLVVRQEGKPAESLISVLDESHLVERVRGFSLEYHAVWQVHKPQGMTQPFWMPILDRDIRKLPPPALAESRVTRAKQRSSIAPSTASADSLGDMTGSTTAVETTNEFSQPSPLPSSTFSVPKRKKKTRIHVEPALIEPQARYWNEYDHPEDGEHGDDAYVLYVDPNEPSFLDRFFEKANKFFGIRHSDDTTSVGLPGSPVDDESSSDEEAGLVRDRHKSYGTLSLRHATLLRSPIDSSRVDPRASQLPQVSLMCFIASFIILSFAFILAFTGRHKYLREVQGGIIVAIISCLAFVVVGVLAAFRRDTTGTIARVIATAILFLEAVASGGLVAWYFI